MYFTQSEIIALNSVLDGSDILGIKISTSENKTKEYYETTINNLREKGMVSSEGNKPTKLFVAAAKVLESYKTAKKHIFINGILVGMNNKLVTALVPRDEGYEVLRTDKMLFLTECVLSNESLSSKSVSDISSYDMEHKSWIDNVLPKLAKNVLLVQVFSNRKILEMLIFYKIEGQDYIYYPGKQKCVKCGSLEKRKELLRILEIKEPSEEQ